MENYTFSDSSRYANISIKVALPVAKDSVSQVIRDSPLSILLATAFAAIKAHRWRTPSH